VQPAAPSRIPWPQHLPPGPQQLQPSSLQRQPSVRGPWRHLRRLPPLRQRLVPVQKRLLTDLCTFCTDRSISGSSRCLPAPGQRPRGARLQSQISVTASSSITPFRERQKSLLFSFAPGALLPHLSHQACFSLSRSSFCPISRSLSLVSRSFSVRSRHFRIPSSLVSSGSGSSSLVSKGFALIRILFACAATSRSQGDYKRQENRQSKTLLPQSFPHHLSPLFVRNGLRVHKAALI